MKKLLPTHLTLRLHLAAVLFAALVGQAAAQNNLTNGLVAYYPFNGNANDASGVNINGSPFNAVLSADRFGNTNSAYSFNGVDSVIAPVGNFNPVAGSFTVTVWFKPNPCSRNWIFMRIGW